MEQRYYDASLLEAWQRGAQEFNAGQHWEAHEAWERGWKTLPELERSWVQGWIQLAGVIHLRSKGRLAPALALSARALFKLASAESIRSVLPRLEVEGGEAYLKCNLDGNSPKELEMALKALKAKLLPGNGL